MPSHARCKHILTFKHLIHEHFDPPRPPAYFTFGSKRGNILHTRLRTGASKLNAHLYKFLLTDSPSCTCGHRSETVEHFILHCVHFNNIRKELFRKLSAILGSTFNLLSNQIQIDILLNGRGLDRASGQGVASCFQRYLIDSQRFY